MMLLTICLLFQTISGHATLSGQATAGTPTVTFTVMGDSKSAFDAQFPWPPVLLADLTTARLKGINAPTNLATSGWTSTDLKNHTDQWLADNIAIPPAWVLINIGANGIVIADVAYVLDAIHVAWPNTKVLVARIWGRFSTPDVWNDVTLPGLISTRPWCGLGIDERITIKDDDDGEAETIDGLHYSAFGSQQASAAWKTLMGY